jgi:hypothetical protein
VTSRSLLAAVIREASALGLTPVERIALILAVAFLLVLGKEGVEAARRLATVSEQEPTRENDGGGPSTPDAEWATHDDPDDRPPG